MTVQSTGPVPPSVFRTARQPPLLVDRDQGKGLRPVAAEGQETSIGWPRDIGVTPDDRPCRCWQQNPARAPPGPWLPNLPSSCRTANRLRCSFAMLARVLSGYAGPKRPLLWGGSAVPFIQSSTSRHKNSKFLFNLVFVHRRKPVLCA